MTALGKRKRGGSSFTKKLTGSSSPTQPKRLRASTGVREALAERNKLMLQGEAYESVDNIHIEGV
jgi:hypothetical protein